ncbi:PDC sensor domain-containing protein [Paraburkholderia sp. CI3]|uniref:PDC sensor domain-containing protein n=1 Tax=Paraburkholderia sp. CI3 TaxID=2991060 RepID=UPI003D20F23C
MPSATACREDKTAFTKRPFFTTQCVSNRNTVVLALFKAREVHYEWAGKRLKARAGEWVGQELSKKNTFHSYRGATAKYILQALLQPVAGCGMSVAIVMIALSAFVLYQSRRDAAEYTRINLRNIALIAERDIERNFALYQLSLQTIIERLRQPRIMTLPLAVRRQVLFDRMATAGSLGTVLVVDRSGRVLLDSDDATPEQVSVASQKYFIVQRDDPHAGFYISDPYSSP